MAICIAISLLAALLLILLAVIAIRTALFKSKQLIPVSGEWDAKRIILIRFENKDTLRKCFQSEEYKKIAQLRKQSTESKAAIIEG